MGRLARQCGGGTGKFRFALRTHRHLRRSHREKTPINAVTATRPNDLRLFLGDCAKLFTRTAWRPKPDVCQIFQDIHAWVQANESALAKL